MGKNLPVSGCMRCLAALQQIAENTDLFWSVVKLIHSRLIFGAPSTMD